MNTDSLFQLAHVKQHFGRAAESYEDAAALQKDEKKAAPVLPAAPEANPATAAAEADRAGAAKDEPPAPEETDAKGGKES